MSVLASSSSPPSLPLTSSSPPSLLLLGHVFYKRSLLVIYGLIACRADDGAGTMLMQVRKKHHVRTGSLACWHQPGAISLVPSAWCHQPGAINLVPSTWCHQPGAIRPGAISLVPSAWCHQPGAISLVPSTWWHQTGGRTAWCSSAYIRAHERRLNKCKSVPVIPRTFFSAYFTKSTFLTHLPNLPPLVYHP